jgi:hypothetical protein
MKNQIVISAKKLVAGDLVITGKNKKEIIEVLPYKCKESELVYGSDDIGRFVMNKHYTDKIAIRVGDKRTTNKDALKTFDATEKVTVDFERYKRLRSTKEYIIFKNGTRHGSVHANSIAEARKMVFATYGESREVARA